MFTTVAQLVLLPMLGVFFAELIKFCVPFIGFKHKLRFQAQQSGKNVQVVKLVTKYLTEQAWYKGEEQFDQGDREPNGLLMGKWFVAWITISLTTTQSGAPSKHREVHLWCTDHTFRRLKETFPNSWEDEEEEKGKKEVAISTSWVKMLVNDFTWRGCNEFSILKRLVPKMAQDRLQGQQKMVDQITSHFDSRKEENEWPEGNAVVLITGKPGTGKSTIATLLTQKIGGVLCSCLRPTDPGTNLTEVLNYHESNSSEKPLVLLIDEFDRVVEPAHRGEVKPSTKHVTEVTDKSSLNAYLDRITTIPNLYVILTSNWTIKQFNALDPSYIRDGRVTMRLEL